MNSFCTIPDYFVDISSGKKKMPSMHYHTAYELYYLQAGSREYFIEDKLFSVLPGDFVLIPPGKLHRTGGEYGERILINFHVNFLQKFYTEDMIAQLVQCFDAWKRTPSPTQQNTCTHLLKKILESKDEATSALLLGTLLMELNSISPPVMHENAMNPIVAFINQNYATITSLEEIADRFYISKHHLCRIFKKTMKLTVVDYLTQIRLKHACQMLLFSQMPIGKISDACGFHSSAYFSRVFKENTGKSPVEYRRENRGNPL